MKGLIQAIDAENLKTEVPSFNVGDTVKVGYKIIEGRQGKGPEFRGRRHRQEKRRHQRDVHRTPYFLRDRRGKGPIRSILPRSRPSRS